MPGHFHHQIFLLTHFHLPPRFLVRGYLAQASLTITIVVAVIMDVEGHWLLHHSHSLQLLIAVARVALALCAPQLVPAPPSSLPLPALQELCYLSVY